MRPHGRAQISARAPRALAICQRCSFMYNLDTLQWQWDWQQGPRLFNLRVQVCPTCLDTPQESGRTIVLPPDPIPKKYPVPEFYVQADNPLSPLGFSPGTLSYPLPAATAVAAIAETIGNMTLNGGLNAAFNGTLNKRAIQSAALSISQSSFQNFAGKNWNADPSGTSVSLPSTVAAVAHVVASFTLTAPNDAKFLNNASGGTGVQLQGSADGVAWTALASATTAGTVGESLTAASTATTAYQYHRIAIQGDGISAVYLAQAQFNVSDAAPNDI